MILLRSQDWTESLPVRGKREWRRTLERHREEQQHLWSAVTEGIGVSGSFKNKVREGVGTKQQL